MRGDPLSPRQLGAATRGALRRGATDCQRPPQRLQWRRTDLVKPAGRPGIAGQTPPGAVKRQAENIVRSAAASDIVVKFRNSVLVDQKGGTAGRGVMRAMVLSGESTGFPPQVAQLRAAAGGSADSAAGGAGEDVASAAP